MLNRTTYDVVYGVIVIEKSPFLGYYFWFRKCDAKYMIWFTQRVK